MNAEEKNWRKPNCVAKAGKASLFGTQGETFRTFRRFSGGDGDFMKLGIFSFGTLRSNVTCRAGIKTFGAKG